MTASLSVIVLPPVKVSPPASPETPRGDLIVMAKLPLLIVPPLTLIFALATIKSALDLFAWSVPPLKLKTAPFCIAVYGIFNVPPFRLITPLL